MRDSETERQKGTKVKQLTVPGFFRPVNGKGSHQDDQQIQNSSTPVRYTSDPELWTQHRQQKTKPSQNSQ